MRVVHQPTTTSNIIDQSDETMVVEGDADDVDVDVDGKSQEESEGPEGRVDHIGNQVMSVVNFASTTIRVKFT